MRAEVAVLDRRITKDELRGNDGQGGRPAYVAYQGKVYDVSRSGLWPGGVHQRRHQAGRDLTADLAIAPHDEAVLQRVPMVSYLASVDQRRPHPLLGLYLDLQAHPIAIHFPIALTVTAAGFLILYLLTDVGGLAESAYYAFLTGVALSPVAIVTGFGSWWFNYAHRWNRLFRGKVGLSAAFFPLGIVTAVLWATNRDALAARDATGWLYFGLVMVMAFLAVSLGRLGGEIVFPSRRG